MQGGIDRRSKVCRKKAATVVSFCWASFPNDFGRFNKLLNINLSVYFTKILQYVQVNHVFFYKTYVYYASSFSALFTVVIKTRGNFTSVLSILLIVIHCTGKSFAKKLIKNLNQAMRSVF